LKAKESSSLNIYPYQKMIITDRYLITGPRIFYLYNKIPLEDGILDMELLTEPDNEEDKFEKKFASGVFQFSGSDQFMCVYKIVPKVQSLTEKVEMSYKYL